MSVKQKLPQFRTCYIFVGVFQCFLALNILIQGTQTLAPFGVPEATLILPHYEDAIHWVYTHMFVLGLLITTIGLKVTEPGARTTLSRLLFVLHAYYTFLDFRSSDSWVGNGLYKGDASLMPAFLALGFTMIFAYLSISKTATGR